MRCSCGCLLLRRDTHPTKSLFVERHVMVKRSCYVPPFSIPRHFFRGPPRVARALNKMFTKPASMAPAFQKKYSKCISACSALAQEFKAGNDTQCFRLCWHAIPPAQQQKFKRALQSNSEQKLLDRLGPVPSVWCARELDPEEVDPYEK